MIMLPPVLETIALNVTVLGVFGYNPLRVFPFGQAPEGTIMPYATWSIIDGTPENCLGGDPDIDQYEIGFQVYAKEGATCRTAAGVLIKALEKNFVTSGFGPEYVDAETKLKVFEFEVVKHVQR